MLSGRPTVSLVTHRSQLLWRDRPLGNVIRAQPIGQRTGRIRRDHITLLLVTGLDLGWIWAGPGLDLAYGAPEICTSRRFEGVGNRQAQELTESLFIN